jgi:hypothetical protein
MKLSVLFAIVVGCATASSFAQTSQPLPIQPAIAPLRPDWERNFKAPITDIRVSSAGRCVAVSTSESIAVIDSAGRELWRWDFKTVNRFITAKKIAVSPKCDWVAFVGSPDYRYSWIVNRDGKRIPIKMEGTPLSIDINHAGNGVAIGTGAGLLFLYSFDGSLKWKLDRRVGLPIDEVSFASDDSAILISGYGQAIASALGKILWSGGWGVGSMRASQDFKTFVSWGEPPHGPGIGGISLLDQMGKTLWTKVSSDPRAIISPAGDYIVAQTNDNQDPSEEDGYGDIEELPKALRLLSRSGDVVRTFRAYGSPVSFSSDGRAFILKDADSVFAINLSETPLWRIAASGPVHIVPASDFHAVVVAQENRVSWYSPRATAKP